VKLTRLQQALLAVSAALVIALAATFRRVPRPPREAAPAEASAPGPEGVGKPTTLLSGFDYSESAAGKTRFSVHADRTVGFAQGAGLPSTWYRLEKVALTLTSTSGEPLVVRSDAADYDPRTKAMHLTGNVVARDPRGTEVRSAVVLFDPAASRLVLPGEVTFRRGAVSGRAASAVYQTVTRVLALAGPVTAAGAGPDAPFDSVRADAGEYRGLDGEISLSGGARAERGPDSLSSDRLTFHALPDNTIDRALATGNVSGTMVSSGGRAMYTAAQADAAFDGKGSITAVDLLGSPARVVSPPAGRQPERHLSAPRIRLGVAAGRLTKAEAFGRPRLDRIADKNGTPFEESITSDSATATFAPDGTLATSRFDGDVVGVTVQGTSRSPAAEYSASTDGMTLLAAGDRDAELDAERGKLLARRIDIDGRSGVIVATEQARVYLRPGEGNASVPSWLASSKKPTRGKARRIALDDRAKTASLDGEAALWQEEDSLLADAILLRDADRSVRADGHVRVSQRSAAASGEKPPPSTLTSSRMRYTDTEKVAVFEQSVVVTRGTQVARGDRAECRFDSDNRVDRTILDGHVTLDDRATRRRGSGTRAVDEPKAGVTNLAGNPAVAEDGQGNIVKGAVLTFRKESGSVEVKAREGGRIESIYQTHGR